MNIVGIRKPVRERSMYGRRRLTRTTLFLFGYALNGRSFEAAMGEAWGAFSRRDKLQPMTGK
jgi:hypothetical protein